MNFVNKIKLFFNRGDERSAKMKKNTVWLIVIQLLSICVNFILVPITIRYVDSDVYGIWITISSMVAWISIMNIGLNNSLRNRFTESLAKNDLDKAQRYVSTTYALLSIIFGGVFVVFIIANPFISWSGLLNLPQEMNGQLRLAMMIVVGYFCLRFVLSSINMLLLADQRPASSALRTLCEQVCSLIVIFILTKTTQGALMNLCLGLCIPPVIVLVLFNVALFRDKYKRFAPKLSLVDFSLSKDLFNIGLKFFIINIAGVIQFQMINFIIIRYYGAIDVTAYNIAFKYFHVVMIAFSVLTTPIWSAVTDANARGDYEWIKKTVKAYFKIIGLFGMLLTIMLVLSPYAYLIWIGKDFLPDIPLTLSMMLMLYNLSMIFGSVFVNVLNGINKLNLQLVSCIVSPILFIGLCYLFIYVLHFGISYIVLASIICNFNGWLVAPIQYYCSFYKSGARAKLNPNT